MVANNSLQGDSLDLTAAVLQSKAEEVRERESNLEKAEAALAKRHALAEAKELDLMNRDRHIRFREDDLKQYETNIRLQVKKDLRSELTGAASQLASSDASQVISGMIQKMDTEIQNEERSLQSAKPQLQKLNDTKPSLSELEGDMKSSSDLAFVRRSNRSLTTFDPDCISEGKVSKKSFSALDEACSMCSALTLDSLGPAKNPLPMAHPANARANEVYITSIALNLYSVEVYGSESLSDDRVTLSHQNAEEGVVDVAISVNLEGLEEPVALKLLWNHPQLDTHYRWHPGCHLDRNIVEGGVRMRLMSSISQQAPFQCLFAANGTNRMSFALSDIESQIATTAAVIEETCNVECTVDLGMALLERHASNEDSYHVTLRIDTRPLSVAEVADSVAQWWAKSYPPIHAPDAASTPLYSTWYSFHQQMDQNLLLQELHRAKALKMEVVIIDDGWQTDDNTRGYAYCGDWEVTESKFPHFSLFVKEAHRMGLKVLLWIAVPFVGEYSRACQCLQGCFLNPELITLQDVPHDLQQTQGGWHILDPRVPMVRRHIVDTLVGLMRKYDIDGFKLDFIDSFQDPTLVPHEVLYQKGAGSMAAAINQLLLDIRDSLLEVKPDVLVEFRQKYTGPAMLQVGNMIRASDVPSNVDGNRVRTLDLRLMAGVTPVHSDPLMWHPQDSPESVAMHFIHTIFAVPQVSVQLSKLPASHVQVIRFYLDWWVQHKDLLLHGQFLPIGIPALYTACMAHHPDDSLLCVWYQPIHLSIPVALPPNLHLINGSPEPWLTLSAGLQAKSYRYQANVYSCTGQLMGTKTIDVQKDGSPVVISVPQGGLVQAKLMDRKETAATSQ